MGGQREDQPGAEPTPAQQTLYWELAREVAVQHQRGDVEGEAEARSRLDMFLEIHAGKRFRVFDPDDVHLAVDPDLEPLDSGSKKRLDRKVLWVLLCMDT